MQPETPRVTSKCCVAPLTGVDKGVKMSCRCFIFTVMAVVGSLLLMGCTSSNFPAASSSMPGTSVGIIATMTMTTTVSTAGQVSPISTLTVVAGSMPSIASETVMPTTTMAGSTRVSIPLSQPLASYSLPTYLLCGQQFAVLVGSTLYKYPDLPKTFNPGEGSLRYSMTVVLGADCEHGASVTVSPGAAAEVSNVVLATDGKPLVVQIIPRRGARGIATFGSNGGGAAITTRFL